MVHRQSFVILNYHCLYNMTNFLNLIDLKEKVNEINATFEHAIWGVIYPEAAKN